jgi:kynurenine formamidase
MIRFIELSHPLRSGMQTYPGLPAPVIDSWLTHESSRDRYAPGTEFHIGRIAMVANTGTYIDAPFHRYRDGADLAALPLAAVAGLDCVVVRTGRAREIGPSAFEGIPLDGRALLVHTGWSRHWGRPAYFDGHPFLTAEAGRRLVAARVALVGIDSLNIDGTADGSRPVHSALLAAGIPIVEHLCGLEHVPDRGAHFFAVPPRVEGMGSFPVRAFAMASV